MSDAEDHIEVVLDDAKIDDSPEIEVTDEAKIEKKSEKAETAHEIEPEEGIQELKRRLEAEKQARIEAERRAHLANQQVTKAYSEAKDSNYQLVVNAIETAKGRADILKNAYRESMAVGDYDKAAEVQQAMIENDRQLSDLKRGEKVMKAEKEKAEEPSIEPMPRDIDVVEQMARDVSPKSAAWLRDNREALQDTRNIRKMFRAHEDALEDGIQADSHEYFSFIEQRLGIHKSEETSDPMSAAAAPAPRRSAPPPAAPVSRGGQRPNVVRLSREQAETAKMMGMTESEYAKNMLALQKEGKIRA